MFHPVDSHKEATTPSRSQPLHRVRFRPTVPLEFVQTRVPLPRRAAAGSPSALSRVRRSCVSLHGVRRPQQRRGPAPRRCRSALVCATHRSLGRRPRDQRRSDRGLCDGTRVDNGTASVTLVEGLRHHRFKHPKSTKPAEDNCELAPPNQGEDANEPGPVQEEEEFAKTVSKNSATRSSVRTHKQ